MVSKTTVLVISLACGAAALVAIIVIVSIYLWKQKQKKMKISDNKSLDTIESATSKDKIKSGERTSEHPSAEITKLADNHETNQRNIGDIQKEKETVKSKRTPSSTEKETYPSFVTLFQVGNTDSLERVNEKSQKKRSKSIKEKSSARDKEDKNESSVKRNDTISFPVKPMEKLRRSIDRNDSLVNTFIDRSKTETNVVNLFSYSKKEMDAPVPKMTLSRTPSRCWEDLSADLENLNNLEGSSESDEEEKSTNQQNTNATPNDNKLSDTSTSDNMSYVVDPVKKTFVLKNTKKKVNIDGNDDTDSLTSNESDLETSTELSKQIDSDTDRKTTDDSDGEIFPQKILDSNKQQTNVNHKYQNDDSTSSKRNHHSQTYHFPASVSQTGREICNSLTEVKEYEDPFISTENSNVPPVSIFRPKTPQPSKENEIKRITNLSRCKSIPSNSRLNITPRFKAPSQKKDDSDVINQSLTDDESPALTKFYPETNTFDTSMTNNDSAAHTNIHPEESRSNEDNCKIERNFSYLETVSEKEIIKKTLDKGSPRENREESIISNRHDEASIASSDLTSRIGVNDKMDEYSSIEQRNTLLSEATATERMKVTVSGTGASAELSKTPVTKDSNTGPPQHQIPPLTVYPSSLLATSGSRKRKHSAIRASTPVPTLDAKPKKGILKKLAERKRLLQVRIPGESVSPDDDILNEEETDQLNDMESDLHNSVTIENETGDRVKDKPLTNYESSNRNPNQVAESIAEGENQVTGNNSTNANAENSIILENEFNGNDNANIVNTNIQDTFETTNGSGSPNITQNFAVEKENIPVKDIAQPEKYSNSQSNSKTLFSTTNDNTFNPDIVVARATSKDEARDSSGESHNATLLSEIKAEKETYKYDRKIKFQQDDTHEIISEMKNISTRVRIHECNNLELESNANLKYSEVTEPLKSKIPNIGSIKEHEIDRPAEREIEQRESEYYTEQFDLKSGTKKPECITDKKPSTKETDQVLQEAMACSNISIPVRGKVAEDITDEDFVYLQSDTLEETKMIKPETDSREIEKNKPHRGHTQKRYKESITKATSQLEDDDVDKTGREYNYIKEKTENGEKDFAIVMKMSNEDEQAPFLLNDIESDLVNVSSPQNKEQVIANHISDSPIMESNGQKEQQQSSQQSKELKVERNLEMTTQILEDKMLIVPSNAALDKSNGISAKTRLVKENKKRSKSFAGQIIKKSNEMPPLYRNTSVHGSGKTTEPNTTVDSKNDVNENFETGMPIESNDHKSSTVLRKTGRFSMSNEYANRQQLGNWPKSEHNTVNLSSTTGSPKSSSKGTISEQCQDGVSGTDSIFPSSPSIVRNTGGITRRKTIHCSSSETSQSLLSPKMPSLQKGLRETDLRTRPRHFNTFLQNSTNHSAIRNAKFGALPGEMQSFGSVANFKAGSDQANSFEATSPPYHFSSGIKRNEHFDPLLSKHIDNKLSTVYVEKEVISNPATSGTGSLQTIPTSISSDFGLKRNETFHTAVRPKTKHNRSSDTRSKSFNKKQGYVETREKAVSSDDLLGSPIVEKPSTFKPSATYANGTSTQSKTLSPSLGVQQPREHTKVGNKTEEKKIHSYAMLNDPVLHSEKRYGQERPSSSYGRTRSKSFNDSPDKAISRRPTTAADIITTKRTGLRRSKDKRPNLHTSDDTLSDASQISDDMQEIVPIDNSSTNRTSNKIHQTEANIQKSSSSQPKLLQIATRSNSKETIEIFEKSEVTEKPTKRNLVSPIKTDLLPFYPIKNDLIKRDNSYSVQRMHEHHRSSTPVVENVNKINFERGRLRVPRIPNDNDKQTLSITDQIKEKLTSTFTSTRSKPTNITTGRGGQGKIDRVSSNVRLPSEKSSQNLTRSITIGHGDRYPASNNQTKPVERSQTPALGEGGKLQYRYDVKSILESAELLKSRNRYSHHMRTKSFNHF